MAEHNHTGHRQRIRHRVRTEGLDNFHDYQVLEYALSFVIPYKDVNPLAHELINKFGSLGGVLEANEEDLMVVDGMGEVSSQFLTSILKIYAYYEKEKSKQITILNNPQVSVEFVRSFLKGKLLEELYAVCLTAKSKVVKVERIAKGSSAEANINIRNITDMVSRNKVSNIIIAHNHPSGIAEPSLEDDKFTKALVTTLAINDCHLIDHIIIGEGEEYFSYRSSAKIDLYRQEIAELINCKVSQPMAPYNYEVKNDKK
jgi:DNA repair protein RadC